VLTIWIEKKGYTGKPDIFHRYNSNGRLMKHTRKVFGFVIEEAEYTRFGEDIQINGQCKM